MFSALIVGTLAYMLYMRQTREQPVFIARDACDRLKQCSVLFGLMKGNFVSVSCGNVLLVVVVASVVERKIIFFCF